MNTSLERVNWRIRITARVSSLSFVALSLVTFLYNRSLETMTVLAVSVVMAGIGWTVTAQFRAVGVIGVIGKPETIRQTIRQFLLWPFYIKWEKEPPKILRPPTFWLDRIARFFWSAKTYERVFAPVKADLVHEWRVAEEAGQRRKAWYIRWGRGPATQLSHMVAQVPWSIAKRVVDIVGAAFK